MLQLAVSQLTTFRWSLEEDLAHFTAAGLKGIGLWRPKLSDCGEEDAVDLIAESGLSVSSLQWAGGFTGSEGYSQQDGIDDGIDAIHLAAAVQTENLILYTGGRGGHTHKHARRISIGAIQELLPHAELMDVNLAVEPMHRGCGSGWTILQEIEDALRFIDEIDHPNMKLVLDTYQFGRDERLLQQIPDFATRIGLVQLSDSLSPPHGEQNRLPLGAGDVPLQDIVQCLIENGYEGFFEVELMGPEIEVLDYCDLLHQSCEAMGQLGQSQII